MVQVDESEKARVVPADTVTETRKQDGKKEARKEVLLGRQWAENQHRRFNCDSLLNWIDCASTMLGITNNVNTSSTHSA